MDEGVTTWVLSVLKAKDGRFWARIAKAEGSGKLVQIWNIEQCSDASLLSQEAVTCLDASLCSYLSTTLGEHPPTESAGVL